MPSLTVSFLETSVVGEPIVEKLLRKIGLRPELINEAMKHTNSRSSPKLMSIELVMPSSHLIIYNPLLLLPTIFPSIRVFFNESVLYIRWPKYWSFSFSISLSKEYSGLIFFRMDWLDLLAVQGPKPVQGI